MERSGIWMTLVCLLWKHLVITLSVKPPTHHPDHDLRYIQRDHHHQNRHHSMQAMLGPAGEMNAIPGEAGVDYPVYNTGNDDNDDNDADNDADDDDDDDQLAGFVLDWSKSFLGTTFCQRCQVMSWFVGWFVIFCFVKLSVGIVMLFCY